MDNKKGIIFTQIIFAIMAVLVIAGLFPILNIIKMNIDKGTTQDLLEKAHKELKKDQDFVTFDFDKVGDDDPIVQNSIKAFECALKLQSLKSTDYKTNCPEGSDKSPDFLSTSTLDFQMKELLKEAEEIESTNDLKGDDFSHWGEYKKIDKNDDGNFIIKTTNSEFEIIKPYKIKDKNEYYIQVYSDKKKGYYKINVRTTVSTSCSGVWFGNVCVECDSKKIGYSTIDIKCYIKGFELPQPDIDEDGTLKEKGFNWLEIYRAPKYLFYYDAFTKQEEMIWNRNFGAISYGSVAFAGVLNLGFAMTGGTMKATGKAGKKVFTTAKDLATQPFTTLKKIKGVNIRFPRLLQKESSEQLAKTLTSKEIKERIIQAGYESNEKVISDLVLKNLKKVDNTLYKNIREKIGISTDQLDGMIRKSSSIDNLKQKILGHEKLKNLQKNQNNYEEFVKELSKLDDLADKFATKETLEKSAKLHRVISTLSKEGVFEPDLFKKEIKSITKGLSQLKDNQKDELLKKIEKDMHISKIYEDPTIFNGAYSHTVTGKQFDTLVKNVDDLFDEKGKIISSRAKEFGIGDDMIGFFEKILGKSTQKANSRLLSYSIKDVNPGILKKNGIKRTFTVKYFGGALLDIIGNSREGIIDKYLPKGNNQLILASPYLYAPLEEKKPFPYLKDDILLLDKSAEKNTELGKAFPRFYLASPCKTDLEIYSTKCNCRINDEGFVLKKNDKYYQINPESITYRSNNDYEEKKRYFFDAQSLQDKKDLISKCLSSEVSQSHKEYLPCIQEALSTQKLKEKLIDFFYENYIEKAIDDLNKIDDLDDFFGKNTCVNVDNYPIAWIHDSDIDIDNYPNLFLLKKFSEELFSKSNLINNENVFDLLRLINEPFMDADCLTKKNFRKKEITLFNRHCIEDTDCERFGNDAKCSNNICENFISDKDYFRKRFVELYQQSVELDYGSAKTSNYIAQVFAINFHNLKTLINNDKFKDNFDKKIKKFDDVTKIDKFDLDKTYTIDEDYLLEFIARNFYNSFYLFDESEINTDIAIEECELSKDKISASQIGIFDPFKEFTLTTDCTFVKPINMYTYSNNDYKPNFCYAAAEYEGFREAINTMNTFVWPAIDIAAGGFGSPMATALIAAATGATQQYIDQELRGSMKWPQHKS